MTRPQQASARTLFAAAETLDLKLPKPVEAAREQLDAVRAAVEKIPPHNLGGTATAVADALSRGVDPLTDPGVARAITHAAITQPGVIDHVEAAAFMRLWEACREHSDEIVAALRDRFDQAAATLVSAHERIGDLDLAEDSQAILRMSGDIATTWAQAVAAEKLIDTALAAWVALGRLDRDLTLDKRFAALRLVNPGAAEFDRLKLGLSTITPWGAVRAGLALTLPTPAEFADRRAVLTQERAEIQAAATPTPTRAGHW